MASKSRVVKSRILPTQVMMLQENKKNNPLLSVIVPVFNESDNLPVLYARLKSTIESLDCRHEIVFINDGSSDESILVIKDLATQDSSVKYVDFSRNFGHQVAVTAGLDYCRGDAVVIIDADLQDPPELIAALFSRWQEGFEVVGARRKSRKGESAVKLWTARYFYRLLRRITSIDIPVDTGDYRLIDRSVVEVLKAMPEPAKYIRGQVAWAGFNQTEVLYDRDERLHGKTGYSFKKMIKLAVDGITGFSDAPLKLVTWIGVAVSVLALIMIAYALYAQMILQQTVRGWTSIIISVLFLGGVQMIAIGIIGIYLSRINQTVRNRPLYIVRESNLNGNNKG